MSIVMISILSLCAALFIGTCFFIYVSRVRFRAEELERSMAMERKISDLRARHGVLKETVVKEEKTEAFSLQIYGVAKSLAEALSWTEMAPRLTSGIQKVLGSYDFLLYALEENGQWIHLHGRGHWTKNPPLSEEVGGEVQIFHPPQVQEVLPVLQIPIYGSEAEGSPLKGILYTKVPIDRTADELLAVASEFSQQLSMALAKAMLFTQIELHSRTDGMTGLLRRQAFMERLEDEFKKARAFHTPFCLLMIDIDHFKAVNDSHGHAAGDAVLARVGKILKESFYETDVVGRYGGEEFIILLPRAEVEGVKRKAEALRARVEKENIQAGLQELHVTVSIGLSHYPENGQTTEDLIARADEALYHAKETGRNRVSAA